MEQYCILLTYKNMNKLKSKDYFEYVKKLQAEEFDITTRKNSDYSGDTHAFGNFDMVELLGICSAETGLLVRMTDKISRVITLIQSGKEWKVQDEKITDTLTDLSNYARILNIYILTKEKWTQEILLDTQKDF